MQRRVFLGSLLAGLGMVSGCIGGNPLQGNSQTTTQNDTTTPNGTAPFETTVGNTQVTLEILDREWPAPEESVEGKFDCEAATVTLTGWYRPPTGCHELAFDSLERDGRTVEVTLTSKSQKTTDETTCEGVSYNYRVELNATATLPDKIRVVYTYPRREDEKSFDIQVSC